MCRGVWHPVGGGRCWSEGWVVRRERGNWWWWGGGGLLGHHRQGRSHLAANSQHQNIPLDARHRFDYARRGVAQGELNIEFRFEVAEICLRGIHRVNLVSGDANGQKFVATLQVSDQSETSDGFEFC